LESIILTAAKLLTLMTFANSLDPDAQQNKGPHLEKAIQTVYHLIIYTVNSACNDTRGPWKSYRYIQILL